ncbi:MAG: hypothetical protein AMXMBFR84_39120 [Candidatus Hydrogenedentota bacterium]
MEIRDAIKALSGLAQDTRLRIFRLLVKACPHGIPAGEIALRLDIPNATLTFHLNHLVQAGLIESQREGRSILYSVDSAGVRRLLEYLMEDCCKGLMEDGADAIAGCAPAQGCCGVAEKTGGS